LPDRVSRFAILIVLSVSAAWAASTGFRDAVLADTPDAYYRLGETSGTVAAEAADPLLNGTYVGSPTLGIAGSGTGDTAVTFNGASQAVRLDNFAPYGSRLATSTYEFVLKTTTTAQGFIFGQTNTGTATAVSVQLNTGASGTAATGATRFFLRAQDGTAYGASFVNAALYGGGYVHLVFSYDRATGLKVYVNGVQQTLSVVLNTITGASTFANFTQPLHVAALNNRGTITGYADVTLDEVALYPVALSATAVAAHYAAFTAPPPGVVNISTAHDFAVPANVTVDASNSSNGLATIAAFRATTAANRYVYSFETWPETTASLGAATYTFQFDLNADGAADQKVTFSNVSSLSPSAVLTKATPGTATSSPSTALGGLGDVGWSGGRSLHTISFSMPVSAVGLVYRSASDLKLLNYSSGGGNYPVTYTLTDGTVVNLGAKNVIGATLTGGVNTFVGVIDATGKGIVSINICVTGSVSGAGQSFVIDDLGFSIIPTPAVANPISLRSSHDFSSPANIAANASAQLAGLSSLADFRALSGLNRHVYSFSTWPQSAASLGANTYAFPFDLDGNGTSDQTVTISSSSGALLTKTVLGTTASSPDNVLGGLGDIGGTGGNVTHTFTFLKPVSAFGFVYRSPATSKLQSGTSYPVSYTLADNTVVNVGTAGVLGASFTANTNTFVGVIDSSGKGIISLTTRLQGSGVAGVQNVTIDDLAFVVAGPPPGTWTLAFEDNFGGTSLDTAKWNTGPRWWGLINQGTPTPELQGYVPQNISVANGLCTILINKPAGGVHQVSGDGHVLGGTAQVYGSGMIQTYGKWTTTYGYFEARIRMAPGKGTWPAFWLLPDRGVTVPANDYLRTSTGDRWINSDGSQSGYMAMGNEIDITEYMNTWKNPTTGMSRSHSGYIYKEDVNFTNVAFDSYALENDGNGPAQYYFDNPDTKFHTYGVYWGPGQLIYYIDGKPVLKHKDSATIASCPEYMILNCAVSQNDWTGTNVPLADIDAGMTATNTMDIDYVRVWSGTLAP